MTSEEQRAYRQSYNAANRERVRGWSKNAYERKKEYFKRVAEERKKREEQAQYGDQSLCRAFKRLAAVLSTLHGRAYHADHVCPLHAVDEDGRHIACGLEAPWNLQIVPAGVNLRKSNKIDHETPHALLLEDVLKLLDGTFPNVQLDGPEAGTTKVTTKGKVRVGIGRTHRVYDPTKGRDGLINLLSTTDAIQISSKEVEALTGISSRNLKVELAAPSVAPVAATYGWSIVPSKAIGKPGKGNWLVKQPQQ